MRRIGTYQVRVGCRSRLGRWLSVSPVVLAAAVLVGCEPAGPANMPEKSATPATTTPPASVTANGICVTSALKGSCGPYRDAAITGSNGQNTHVGQDVWNPIPGWSQTLHATSPGNWFVTASMPAWNTAVVSYPNVGQQYYSKNTLAEFSSIYSSFSENMHQVSGTSAEAGYDIWLNGWKNEVMIQHDIVNRGSCSVSATAEFGGPGGVPVQSWNLCKYGSELIWQLSGKAEQTGQVNVLAMLTWLVTHRYLPGESGLTAISYGFELCSTGGKPETFRVSRFSITSARRRLPVRTVLPSHHVINGAGVEQFPDSPRSQVLG